MVKMMGRRWREPGSIPNFPMFKTRKKKKKYIKPITGSTTGCKVFCFIVVVVSDVCVCFTVFNHFRIIEMVIKAIMV